MSPSGAIWVRFVAGKAVKGVVGSDLADQVGILKGVDDDDGVSRPVETGRDQRVDPVGVSHLVGVVTLAHAWPTWHPKRPYRGPAAPALTFAGVSREPRRRAGDMVWWGRSDFCNKGGLEDFRATEAIAAAAMRSVAAAATRRRDSSGFE